MMRACVLVCTILTAAMPAIALDGPETSERGDGWQMYEEPLKLSPNSAGSLEADNSTPEGAVLGFYASVMNGEIDSSLVLNHRGLDELSEWEFVQINLLGKKQESDNEVQIKLFFAIKYRGHFDSGKDEIGLARIDNKWFIKRVPL